MSADPLTVGRESIEAFNAGDRDRFRATLAETAVEREHATRTTTDGGDAGQITGAFADGGRVTLQIVWTGTHDGDMHGPDGTVIPATGRKVAVPACMVQEVRDGRIVAVDPYFRPPHPAGPDRGRAGRLSPCAEGRERARLPPLRAPGPRPRVGLRRDQRPVMYRSSCSITNCFSSMSPLTMSPMLTMPTTSSFSNTGR